MERICRSPPKGAESSDTVPHVIALLASDTLADHALFALRKVAEERVGELTDALLDANLDDTVRCRLTRVFAVCVSQRGADGLVLGLDDARFDVRFQSAQSLAAILEKNPVVRVDPERIYALFFERSPSDRSGRRGFVSCGFRILGGREPPALIFRLKPEATHAIDSQALTAVVPQFATTVILNAACYDSRLSTTW